MIGTKTSYNILEPFQINSRNILSIQNAGKRIANFIGLEDLTFIIATAKQKENVGGHIDLESGSKNVFVEISDDVAEFDEAILAALAHEVSHKYMQINGISCGAGVVHDYENEVLTDITAVFLGFGKIMLNGCSVVKTSGNVTKTLKVGYLESNQLAFVYRLVCSMRNISQDKILSNLSKNALSSVRDCKHYYTDYFDYKYHSEEFRNEILTKLKEDVTSLQAELNQTNKDFDSFQDNYINKTKKFLENKKEFVESIENRILHVKKDTIYDPSLRFLESINIKNWKNQTTIDVNECISEINNVRKRLSKLHKKV